MIRVLLASLLLSTPAVAEPWDCTFNTTCMASLDCFDQDNSARLIAADHAGELFLEWQGEQFRATALDDGTTYAAIGPDGSALLSIIGPLAYLTTHQAAVTSFFGSCETIGN